jgi:hypothetical protein
MGVRPQLPVWLRAAAIVAGCLVLAVLTVHFITELRLPLEPDDPAAPDVVHYRITDFAQEWVSGRNLLRRLPIYGDQVEAMDLYLGRRPRPTDSADFFVIYNAHPPTSVLLAAPFAWMDYPDAFMAWNLASLVLLAATLWVVVSQLGVRVTPMRLLAAWALLLLCNPVRHQILQGQLNLVLLALIVGAWALERSDRPLLAGALLGLAAAVKLFPGFLLVYYAMRGRWRVVLGGGATAVVATALTVLVVGVEAYRVYFHDVVPHVARYRDWWVNASLLGLWSKLFEANSGHVLPLVRSPCLYGAALVGSLILVGAVLLRATRSARSRPEHDLTFSLAVISMLLIGPIIWDHALVLLLVPVAVLGLHFRGMGNWRWLFLVSLAAVWLAPKFVFDHTIGGPGEYRGQVATPRQVLGVISYLCYALIGLWLVAAASTKRERRARW